MKMIYAQDHLGKEFKNFNGQNQCVKDLKDFRICMSFKILPTPQHV